VSEFSKLFSDAVAASGLTQAEVEKTTGIERSVLSRLMSGAIEPSHSNLAALLSKFQPDKKAGLQLVFAYLQDEAAAAGLPVDQVKIMLGDGQSLREKLTASQAADLDLLASEVIENSDFASLLSDWATVIRRHHLALERKVYPFPQAAPASAVAEPKPAPSKARRARADTSFPRGDSQQPTA
jgi:transcriptional regulator with XRE-family HTH domain